MTAATLDLTIERNTDFSQSLILQDSEGSPLNLTGYTFTSMIKRAATDTNALISFTCTVPTPANGTIILSLTNAQTSALVTTGVDYTAPTNLVYDVVQNVSGVKTRIVQGSISLIPAVTI